MIAETGPNLILIVVALITATTAIAGPYLMLRANENARIKREAAERKLRDDEKAEAKKEADALKAIEKAERDAQRLAELEAREEAANQVKIARDTLADVAEAARLEAVTARETLAVATEAAASEARAVADEAKSAAQELKDANAIVAAEALRQQEAVAVQAEAARVALVEQDEKREGEQQENATKLDAIRDLATKTHELTNSQFTAMMEETLDANEGRLVTLLEIQAMQERGGGEVSERTKLTILATEKKILSLRRTLVDRARRTASGDEKTAG